MTDICNMKKIILFFFCSIMALPSFAQSQIVATIDTMTILIGQQAHLTVSVIAPQNSKIIFPSYKRSQYIVPGVEVLSQTKGRTSKLDNNMISLSKVYTLTSFDEHLYAIPGIKVKVGNNQLTSNQLALKVLTIDVDTLHPNQFFPPKDVQDNPFEWNEWNKIFWMSCLIVLMCALCVFLFVRLRQNKPIFIHIRIVKHIPAHQRAMAEIEKIRNERMATSEKQKEYYTKLTDTLRRYIEERFGFNAMEMTSEQIIDHLQSSGDKKMIDELKELFCTADLVKFAKYSTLINENDLNLVNAINFIDETKLETQPTEEKIVPELSKEEKRSAVSRRNIKIFIWIVLISVTLLMSYVVYHSYILMN
jgi:hypothetical protein